MFTTGQNIKFSRILNVCFPQSRTNQPLHRAVLQVWKERLLHLQRSERRFNIVELLLRWEQHHSGLHCRLQRKWNLSRKARTSTTSGICSLEERLMMMSRFQVRHPLERLLATWRHLFKNGGWKSLDGVAATKPEAKKEMEKKLATFTWNYFVDEVVLKDTFVNKSEVELDNFDGMGNWVKHHWAPYWWN